MKIYVYPDYTFEELRNDLPETLKKEGVLICRDKNNLYTVMKIEKINSEYDNNIIGSFLYYGEAEAFALEKFKQFKLIDDEKEKSILKNKYDALVIENQKLKELIKEGVEGQKCTCFPHSKPCFYCRTKLIINKGVK